MLTCEIDVGSLAEQMGAVGDIRDADSDYHCRYHSQPHSQRT